MPVSVVAGLDALLTLVNVRLRHEKIIRAMSRKKDEISLSVQPALSVDA